MKYSSTLFGDATIAMASIPVEYERTKHIAIRYFFIRELVESGVISMEHVDTVADIGTRSLGRAKYSTSERDRRFSPL